MDNQGRTANGQHTARRTTEDAENISSAATVHGGVRGRPVLELAMREGRSPVAGFGGQRAPYQGSRAVAQYVQNGSAGFIGFSVLHRRGGYQSARETFYFEPGGSCEDAARVPEGGGGGGSPRPVPRHVPRHESDRDR